MLGSLQPPAAAQQAEFYCALGAVAGANNSDPRDVLRLLCFAYLVSIGIHNSKLPQLRSTIMDSSSGTILQTKKPLNIKVVVDNCHYFLDVEGESPHNVASIIQYPFHGKPNQQFRLDPIG